MSSDEVVTMVDVLEEQREIELKSAALCKDARCTYDQRPMKQAAYACRTCRAQDVRPASFCLGCSLRCHIDHDVFELGEKLFRCDCGNGRNPSILCQLNSDKDEANEENQYGQNHDGLFCWCGSAYNAREDTMYQCAVCEEWYHSHHIDGLRISGDEGGEGAFFDELVCAPCVQRLDPVLGRHLVMPVTTKCSFALEGNSHVLQPWRECFTCSHAAGGTASTSTTTSGDEKVVVDSLNVVLGVCAACASTCHDGHDLGPVRISSFFCDCGSGELKIKGGGKCCGLASSGAETEEKGVATTDAAAGGELSAAAASPAPSSSCPSEMLARTRRWEAAAAARATPLKAADLSAAHGSAFACAREPPIGPWMFLERGWRDELCRCTACVSRYEDAGVKFLVEQPSGDGQMYGPVDAARAIGPSGSTESAGTAAPSASAGSANVTNVTGAATSSGMAERPPTAHGTDDAAGTGDSLAPTLLSQGMAALSALPLVGQLDAAEGYSSMSEKLREFLRPFAEGGKVVSARDIQGFFSALSSTQNQEQVRKRRRFG